MLIPNKFNGYSRDGIRTYHFGDPVSDTVIAETVLPEVVGEGVGATATAAEAEAAQQVMIEQAAAQQAAEQAAAQQAAQESAAQQAYGHLAANGAATAPSAGLPAIAPQGVGAPGTLATANTPGTLGSVSAPVTAVPGAGAVTPPTPTTDIVSGFKNAENWMGQNKLLTGTGAALGLSALSRLRGSVPGPAPYNGPLSHFKYSPETYTPYTYHSYADGGVAQLGFNNANTFSAGGGPGGLNLNALQGMQHPQQVSYAKGGTTNSMAAIDDYLAQAQEGGSSLQTVLAKAQSGDYNAMLALNKLHNTPNQNYAMGGGIANLGGYSDGGQLLRGPGDGVSDSIPATIGGKRPARLADGEFVVPARIVSELGNGSTDAGARKLYSMMDRVQRDRAKTTGKNAVAKDTNAAKNLPV